MLTCEKPRGALVVAADLSLGELVQEEAAGFVEGFGGDDFTAEVTEVGEPVPEVERELVVQLSAKLLGEGGRVPGGGDGDLEVAATDDRREVEVAERRVVDGVADDAFLGGFGEDGTIDCRVVGGGDDEEGIVEVAVFVWALEQRYLAIGGEFGDYRVSLRGDDGDAGVGGAERRDLRLGQMACADDDAWATGEFEEDRKECHFLCSS